MATACRVGGDFTPTAFQERILEALQGRSLHTEELVQAVGDARLFFAGQGGFWELRHLGLVVHDARVGNYRPDAPPLEWDGTAVNSEQITRADPCHAPAEWPRPRLILSRRAR